MFVKSDPDIVTEIILIVLGGMHMLKRLILLVHKYRVEFYHLYSLFHGCFFHYRNFPPH